MIFLRYALQIISADSSYSINTQWPLSQLQALFPSNSNIIIDDSAVAPVLPAPAEEEEWLSFTEYMIRYHACSHTNSNNSVDCSVCTDNLIPAAADTRCPRCIAELLFVCGDSAHCTNSDGTSAYPGYVHGVLSQGSCYVSALNDISGGDRAGYDMQAVSVGCEVGTRCKCIANVLLVSVILFLYFVFKKITDQRRLVHQSDQCAPAFCHN